MAKKIEITLVDDLDGGDAAETVRFSLDGTDYEIDLSTKNAEELRSAVGGYIEAGRRSGGRGRGRPAKPATNGTKSATEVDPKQIRAWAAENHIAVSPRGRVPQALVIQFTEAHAAS